VGASYANFVPPGKAGGPDAVALAAQPSLALQALRRGPVAQGIEQQPSKLKVAGSNPAGVAISIFSIVCVLGRVETSDDKVSSAIKEARSRGSGPPIQYSTNGWRGGA
jgi:hypothetical protein